MSNNNKLNDIKDLDIFEALKNPPFSHSKANDGPNIFPSEKQPRDILNKFIINEVAQAEEMILETYSIGDDRDLSNIKLGNAMSLYDRSENVKFFVMWCFYLLRAKTLSAHYTSIPIELMVLQKLGLYTSLKWLDQVVYLPEESEFIKRYPKAAMRMKNALGKFPFYIKQLLNPGYIQSDCACRELEAKDGPVKEGGTSVNFDGVQEWCGKNMLDVGGVCYEPPHVSDTSVGWVQHHDIVFDQAGYVSGNPNQMPSFIASSPIEQYTSKEQCEGSFTTQTYNSEEVKVRNVWYSDYFNDPQYSNVIVGDWTNYEYECIEEVIGTMYSAEEQAVIDTINNTGTYVFTYSGIRFGIYDDQATTPINLDEFSKECDHLMEWSLVFRTAPKIPFHNENYNNPINFLFEHYKTRWNDEYPDTIHMSPKDFLVKAGYIPSELVSISNLKEIKIKGLAAYLQMEIWDLYEKEPDLQTLFSPDVVAFGLKLLGGSLFIPRSELQNGSNKAGYTIMNDPLMPAGTPLNATLVDVDLFGTFTTKCIDPLDRKYIEEQYYRFRDNQRNKK